MPTPRMPQINYVSAEYDPSNQRVVSLKTDTGEIQGTFEPRVLGAPTEWVPVRTILPVGYDSRFDGLRFKNTSPENPAMRFAYDESQNIVTLDFPQADFSPAALREALSGQIRIAANLALAPTDWTVIRQMETGKAVPEDVKAARSLIRLKVDEYDQKLTDTPDADLNAFAINIEGESGPTFPGDAGVAPDGDGSEWITDATAPDVRGTPVRPAETHEVQNRE